MPGKLISLPMEMFDELNQSASGFMQLDIINDDNQVSN